VALYWVSFDSKPSRSPGYTQLSRQHSRHTRLRDAGLLTLPEMASLLGVYIEAWRRRKAGELHGTPMVKTTTYMKLFRFAMQ
jgi:hypothetical protein